MSITSALVLFVVTWFMVFFVVLPQRIVTQGEANDITPGTPSSAPSDPQIKQKALKTTFWAAIIWAILTAIILSEVITAEDLDIFNRLS